MVSRLVRPGQTWSDRTDRARWTVYLVQRDHERVVLEQHRAGHLARRRTVTYAELVAGYSLVLLEVAA